jgi:hypothetical protein
MCKSIFLIVVAFVCFRPAWADVDFSAANNIAFQHNDFLIVKKSQKSSFDTIFLKSELHAWKDSGTITQDDFWSLSLNFKLQNTFCWWSLHDSISKNLYCINHESDNQPQSFSCNLIKSEKSDLMFGFPTDTTAPLLKKWQVNTFASCYYVGSLTGLYFLWYSDYSSVAFHTFNDSREWKGMDKMGHTITTFHIARIQSELYQAAGYETAKSARIGAICSFGYMTIIEVMDGFSDGWGFSISDWSADGVGLSLFALNELSGRDNLLTLKFSSLPTNYAQYNPELLGKNWVQSTLKDYNGQTYWLSLNIAECLKEGNRFPAWLNMAVGYGANGMIGAEDNPSEMNGIAIPSFERYNQIFLSPDIDFSKIKVNGRGWKLLLSSLNFIKFPAPALEYNNNNGFKLHFLYF